MRSPIMASRAVIAATSGTSVVRLLGADLQGPLDSAGITVP